MKKTTTLLNAFSSEDWKEFKKFTKNNCAPSSSVLKILQILERLKGKEISTSEFLTKANLNISKKSLHNNFYSIRTHIKQFLVWQKLNLNPNLFDYIYFDSLLDKNLTEEAEKVLMKSITSLLDCTNSRDATFFLHLTAHRGYFSQLFIKRTNGVGLLRLAEQSFQNYSAVVSKQYIIEKRHRISNLNVDVDKEDFSFEINNSQLNSTMDLLRKSTLEKQENLEIEIFTSLSSWNGSTDTEEYKFLIQHLLGYVRMKQTTAKEFKSPLLGRIYRLAFHNKVYDKNGYIDPFAILNAQDVLLSLGLIEQANSIIGTYLKKIIPAELEDTDKLSQVQYHFYNECYDEAYDILLGLNPRNIQAQIRSRWLTCMCFYEMKEYDLLLSYLLAFNSYIRRHNNEFSSYTINGLKAFVSILKSLCQEDDYEKLLKKYNSFNKIIKGSWIAIQIKKKAPRIN